jgi:hypothetical protein
MEAAGELPPTAEKSWRGGAKSMKTPIIEPPMKPEFKTDHNTKNDHTANK